MITESRQKRVLLIIITILFLANVATLFLFFMAKPMKKKQGEHSRKERMNGYLKNELRYNDAQLNAYGELAGRHRTDVDSIFSNMRREKQTRFKEMSVQNFSDSSIQTSAERLAENQKILEAAILTHIKDVRALGNEEQRKKFDTGFLNYMSKNKSKKRE